MVRRLRQFYDTFGDKGVMFVMFSISVVVNSLLAMYMELPSVHPDEIGVASIAAFYSGHDWSGLMSGIGYYYGYIQALLYTPLFLIFENPYALYKAMLVMNGVIISIIPLIAYNIASRLGIESVRKKTVTALCCGFYITYVCHSKFIWNEAVCSLMPWLLIWCVMITWQRSKSSSRFSMSLLTGFMCAVAYAAHPRLIAVVIALALTVIIAQASTGEKLMNIPAFLISLIAGFTAENFASQFIRQAVWKNSVGGNTLATEIWRLEAFSESGGAGRFFAALFGHIYTFMTSTAGLGAVAAVIFVVIAASRIKEDIGAWKASPERGTRVYDAVKHKYSARITVFAIYAFLAVGGSVLLSAMYKFGSEEISQLQDLAIFGRYTDNAAPLAVFLVLAFFFLYGAELRHIIYGAGTYGAVCLLFGVITYPVVSGAGYMRQSPVLGLLPWRLTEETGSRLTGTSFVIISSCILTLFALMAVFAACSRRHRTQIISGFICCISAYAFAFGAFVYLPQRAEANKEYISAAQDISALIYNDKQSPRIVFYKTDSRTAGLVQFLDPLTQVVITSDPKSVPESCLLVAESGTEAPFEGGSYDVVGRTDDYTVYAYGESARDFIRYRSTADNKKTNGGKS